MTARVSDGAPRPLDGIDFRAEPEWYEIGRGERGVFHVEPYKGELPPDRFLAYRAAGDFVDMDMARKYLQMGYTRARRYAKHQGGR